MAQVAGQAPMNVGTEYVGASVVEPIQTTEEHTGSRLRKKSVVFLREYLASFSDATKAS